MMQFKSIEEYHSRIKRILITEQEIRERISLAAERIDSLYDGIPILIVGILSGSFIFLSDLCRAVKVPCEIGFMRAQSYYDGIDSSGNVKITLDLDQDIKGHHVVIVEDIIDTGRTLSKLADILRQREPLSLDIITLLDKPERRAVDFKADLSLFTIPDVFVVGYGLDCAQQYRNLPYIAEFAPE